MADTLAAYLSIRAGNNPDAMIINGESRIIYRDYKGRGVLVVAGPDTYDVVWAMTEASIEKLYAAGDYRRWRYDGKDVHEVERPVSDPTPGADPTPWDFAMDAIEDHGCDCDSDPDPESLADHTCLAGRCEYALVTERKERDELRAEAARLRAEAEQIRRFHASTLARVDQGAAELRVALGLPAGAPFADMLAAIARLRALCATVPTWGEHIAGLGETTATTEEG